MTFSPLTTRTIPCDWAGGGNKWASRQGRAVSIIIQHQWAGTSGGIETLSNPSREASTNYLILSDGTIIGQVPEEYRAWTSGGWEWDSRAITIEMQNSTNAPEWRVSDAALKAAVRLYVDVAKRHGWYKIDATDILPHSDFAATACPGPYLKPRLPQLAAEAHGILFGGKPAPSPAPKPTPGKSVHTLAQEVIAGKWGNDPGRAQKLTDAGYNAGAVQAEVNQILTGQPAPTPGKSVRELANEVIAGKHGNGADRQRALGAQFAAVQAEVNRILTGTSSAPTSNASVIDSLARAVIRGDYGNGPERASRLGAQFNAVQARVNQILG